MRSASSHAGPQPVPNIMGAWGVWARRRREPDHTIDTFSEGSSRAMHWPPVLQEPLLSFVPIGVYSRVGLTPTPPTVWAVQRCSRGQASKNGRLFSVKYLGLYVLGLELSNQARHPSVAFETGRYCPYPDRVPHSRTGLVLVFSG